MDWSDFVPMLAGFLAVYSVTGGIAKYFKVPQSKGESRSIEIEALGQVVGGLITLAALLYFLVEQDSGRLLWLVVGALVSSGGICVGYGYYRGGRRWQALSASREALDDDTSSNSDQDGPPVQECDFGHEGQSADPLKVRPEQTAHGKDNSECTH